MGQARRSPGWLGLRCGGHTRNCRKDAFQHAKELAHLRAGHDEGRQKPKRAVMSAIDEQAAIQRFGDKGGAFNRQLDTEHETFTANFTNEIEFCSQGGESLAEFRASRADILQKFFFLDDFQKFQRRRTDQRSAPERRSVHAGRNAGSNGFGSENRAERKSSGERLGDQRDIGFRGKFLISKIAARAAEPALNFTRDEQGATLPSESAGAIPEHIPDPLTSASPFNGFHENAPNPFIK